MDMQYAGGAFVNPLFKLSSMTQVTVVTAGVIDWLIRI